MNSLNKFTFLLFSFSLSSIAFANTNISISETDFEQTEIVFHANEKSVATFKTTPVPQGYQGVKIEIKTKSTQKSDTKKEDVFRVKLYQLDAKKNEVFNEIIANPSRTFVPDQPEKTRIIELESCYFAKENLPVHLKIERLCNDSADTYDASVILTGVKVSPVKKLPEPIVVENKKGYNSWPMIQSWKGKLYYLYTRGSGHTIGEGARDAFLKISSDNGKTWSKEIPFATDKSYGEVPTSKGLDEDGNILFWVRFIGRKKPSSHKLYMSKDGVNFEVISTPKLSPFPMQITDIFKVEKVGLMALWFATDYKTDKNSWGTLVSNDNGKTWKQTIIESRLDKKLHHTEPSAVYLGNGKILVISRVKNNLDSTDKAQFQIESNDYGKTWTTRLTNIGDVMISTPSLIYDKETGIISNYYYQRGRGMLKRRVAQADKIWGNPLAWSKPEIIAFASAIGYDAGNVNATVIGDTHYLAYYSGDRKNASVVISTAKKPDSEKD